MKQALKVLILGYTIALYSCKNNQTETSEDKEPKPETLVEEYNLSEMDKAIALAKSRTKEFLTALEQNNADEYFVKAPITDDNGTEHFWLNEVSYKNGVFKGTVANDPGIVKNVTFGMEWEIKEDEISDWMFTIGEKIHGGFTIDPLLDSYPKEEADALRAKLVR